MSLAIHHICKRRTHGLISGRASIDDVREEVFTLIKSLANGTGAAQIINICLELSGTDIPKFMEAFDIHSMDATREPFTYKQLAAVSAAADVPLWKIMFDVDQCDIDEAICDMSGVRAASGGFKSIMNTMLPKNT